MLTWRWTPIARWPSRAWFGAGPNQRRTALIAGLTIAALLPPALISVSGDRDMAKESTIDQAYSWIVQNIPAGATIVLERRALLLPNQYHASYVALLRRKTYEQWRSEGAEYPWPTQRLTARRSSRPISIQTTTTNTCASSRKPAIHKIVPTAATPGPEMRILKVVP